jgi:hypothetical protein
MTTVLFRKLGEQFSDQNGIPLAGYKLYYYQSGTTNLQDTYIEQTGVTKNTNPIILGSSGRLRTAVFLGSTYDYKEVLTDTNDVTVQPWPFDGIPKAVVTANPITGFERLYMPWLTVTSTPQTIGAAAVGTAYEYDCTLGSIVANLPAANTVLAGTGYCFKKVDSTANIVTITPNGSDTIEGANSPLYIGVRNMAVGIISDGVQWLATLFSSMPFMLAAQKQIVSASAGALSIDMAKGWDVALSLGGTVTSIAVTNWPTTGTLGKLQLDIANTGAYNITGWPGTTVWFNGITPTITSGNGKKDTIILMSSDGGTNFRGYVASQNMS